MDLQTLCESLALIAKVTGGYATVVDKDGYRIKTVNSKGKEIVELRGVFYSEAHNAWLEGKPRAGASQLKKEAQAWFLPLDKWVLVASNIERIEEEERLKQEFEEALPIIAAVAGGEAALFNEKGIRIKGYNPKGELSRGLGELSELSLKSLEQRRPLIGPSYHEEGAMAVRMPIGRTFGISINNEWSVKEKRNIINSIRGNNIARYTFDHIIGKSKLMEECKAQAIKVAKTNSSILIQGETGTGKELFAQAIHNASQRKNAPFVAINCGAIPATLAESILFGYQEGAFTGAQKKGHEGIFEQANGGTIFLDEISEMELNLQVKLLRVIQEKQITRIGSKNSIDVNIRIIASSNKTLKEMVEQEKFRSDLYYRLNVVEIFLPPLRYRNEDILPISRHLILRLNSVIGTSILDVSDEALKYMHSYSWPGNTRELRNCIEHALSIASPDDKYILPKHLPSFLIESPTDSFIKNDVQKTITSSSEEVSLENAVEDTEKDIILKALSETQYNRKKAAKKIGVSTTTLWRRMRKYSIID